MAQPRLNKVIDLLEHGKVVFGGGMAWTDNIEQRIEQGFRIIVTMPARVDRTLEIGKRRAGR